MSAGWAGGLVKPGIVRSGHQAAACSAKDCASLQLYEDGTWYCYGACQTGGSIYHFGSRLWGIGTKGASFLELRDRLAQELRRAR